MMMVPMMSANHVRRKDRIHFAAGRAVQVRERSRRILPGEMATSISMEGWKLQSTAKSTEMTPLEELFLIE